MLLTACGQGGDAEGSSSPSASPQPTQAETTQEPTKDTPEPTETTETTEPSEPVTSRPPAPSPPTSTREVQVDRQGMDPAVVKRVRYAGHPGFDRVVIDLSGAVPGYSVRWAKSLVQDGSGDPIPVMGGAYLQVSLRPANAHTDSGALTWTGGPVFRAGLANVTDVVRTGDFEGVVGVGIVLDHRAAFCVSEQKRPPRLVLDVAH
ncbi:hypothetical protein DP939_27300 [Spongiactinospora rosea]|uniref:AMIN-like domain-containing protein n=2 Tax=Spongiactinospora rosea TaxID=2248750 RepID=A0A366LTU8_9ACTN|nr:hypothetical protein DP939_27300 [Spongiactinospora rosea]